MSELDKYKAAAIQIAKSLSSCGLLLDQIQDCRTPMDLLDLLVRERTEIQNKIENEIDYSKQYNMVRIIDWLATLVIDEDDKETIFDLLKYMPPTDQLVNALTGNNLLNSMKIELLIDMIDQLPLAEMEALHNRYRWNNASASQMQIAV